MHLGSSGTGQTECCSVGLHVRSVFVIVELIHNSVCVYKVCDISRWKASFLDVPFLAFVLERGAWLSLLHGFITLWWNS